MEATKIDLREIHQLPEPLQKAWASIQDRFQLDPVNQVVRISREELLVIRADPKGAKGLRLIERELNRLRSLKTKPKTKAKAISTAKRKRPTKKVEPATED